MYLFWNKTSCFPGFLWTLCVAEAGEFLPWVLGLQVSTTVPGFIWCWGSNPCWCWARTPPTNIAQEWKTALESRDLCKSKKELRETDWKHKSLEDPRVRVCSNRITEGSRSARVTEWDPSLFVLMKKETWTQRTMERKIVGSREAGRPEMSGRTETSI